MNAAKSKVMGSVRGGIVGEINNHDGGHSVGGGGSFVQGPRVTADGSKVSIGADVQQRVLEGSKVLGVVRSALKDRTMS